MDNFRVINFIIKSFRENDIHSTMVFLETLKMGRGNFKQPYYAIVFPKILVLKNANTAKFFKILRKDINNVSQILKFVTKNMPFKISEN